MRLFRSFSSVLVLGLVLLSGCNKQPPATTAKEATKAQRAEAALLLSEAEFAVQLRDHARAEPLLAKAVTIIHDNPDHWLMLGATRKRLGNTSGARAAYREALSLLEKDYKAAPDNIGLVLEQVHAHALLGQADKAKALLEKAGKANPNSRELQDFIKGNGLDRLLQEPGFKEIAL